MSKQKIKSIVKRFLFFNNPDDVKESVQEMYELTMLSEHEISVEQRQEFTYNCREIFDFFSELSAVNKKRLKKTKQKPLSSTP